MLVDLTEKREVDPFERIVSGGFGVKRLAQGVYQMGCWNPEFFFEEQLGDVWPMPDYSGMERDEKGVPTDAGWRAAIDRMNEKNERIRAELETFYTARYGSQREVPFDMPNYGVCDSMEQLLERFPHLSDDDNRYAITMVEIRREDQEDSGGWRYHKWGEYIGVQNPQHEYLYDDTHIDVVWTFHIYRVQA